MVDSCEPALVNKEKEAHSFPMFYFFLFFDKVITVRVVNCCKLDVIMI